MLLLAAAPWLCSLALAGAPTANHTSTLAADLARGAAELFDTAWLRGSNWSASGCAAGSSRLAELLDERRPLRFIAIGSSITGALGGCTHGLSQSCPTKCGGECYNEAKAGRGWVRKLVELLERVRPLPAGQHHEAYNAGKGASHLEHYARCMRQYWPRAGPVDVVILELTIFNACGRGISTIEVHTTGLYRTLCVAPGVSDCERC
jgi:hypothetical protein